MFEKFKIPYDDAKKAKYGRDRDWNLDLIPKFAMANGELVSILVHTDVTRYLEFQQISGSFVYREGSGICKVPSTEYEAATSSLMGLFEKRRAKNFFHYVAQADPDAPSTWNSMNLHSLLLFMYR